MTGLLVALLTVLPPPEPPRGQISQACRRLYGLDCADASRPLPSSPGFQPYFQSVPARCGRTCAG
jgi:hypothetical protein